VPDIVRQIGVTTEKSSPNLTMVVHLVSPDNSRDALYLRNYGQLNVRDELLRIPGMGSVILFGAGDYAMRVWLDPGKLAARSITSSEVIAAIREQNAQVAAGTVGAPPSPRGTDFQLAVNTQGRLANEEQFGDIIVRTDPATGGLIRIKDLGRVELSSGTYSLRSSSTTRRRRRSPCSRRRARTRSRSRTTCARSWSGSSPSSPRAWTTRSSTTRPGSCRPRSRRWCRR
jgi:multidrug efflux pump